MANVLLGIHCVVPGCSSTLRKVNQWKSQSCVKPSHKGSSHAKCLCPEPYQFFKFPCEVKLRKLWLERIRRPDLEVNNLTRVCSLHFVDRKPTRRSYFPTLNLKASHSEFANEKGMAEEGRRDESLESMEVMDEEEEEDLGDHGSLSLAPVEQWQEIAEDTEEEVGIDANHDRVGAEENKYEAQRGTVTITKIGSASASLPPPPNKRNNRFIKDGKFSNVTKPRLPNEQLLGPTGMPQSRVKASPSATSFSLPTPSAQRVQVQVLSRKFIKEENRDDGTDNDSDSPSYTIDEGDDCDEDSSELSDIGIDIQPVNVARLQPSTTACLSKPKLVPVFAQTGPALQTQPSNNVSTTTLIQKPIQPTNRSNTTATQLKTGHGSSSVKCIQNTPLNKESDIEMVYSDVKPKPLATYDLSKQQLQIADPVKYIQECHNRISQLISEKQQLENEKSALETVVKNLQQENNDLRREVATKFSRQRSVRPVRAKPTIKLVPIQDAARTGNYGTHSNQRVRFVIQRPTIPLAIKQNVKKSK